MVSGDEKSPNFLSPHLQTSLQVVPAFLPPPGQWQRQSCGPSTPAPEPPPELPSTETPSTTSTSPRLKHALSSEHFNSLEFLPSSEFLWTTQAPLATLLCFFKSRKFSKELCLFIYLCPPPQPPLYPKWSLNVEQPFHRTQQTLPALFSPDFFHFFQLALRVFTLPPPFG